MSDTQAFFQYLDRRFSSAPEGARFWLSIRGYRVQVEFRGMVPSDTMWTNLKFMLAEAAPAADERLCVWQDSLDDLLEHCMIPPDQRLVHYQQTDEYHIILPGSYQRLSVRDNRNAVTYICYEQGTATPETCATKPFTNEIQWWLWDHYLLVHAAVVGAGGKGALVTAPSGGGKSTLALAALVEGMTFASEDFVLVPRQSPTVGYTLFPTGNLLPDSLEMLPELKDGILEYMESRNKYVVDLSRYEQGFRSSIPLTVLVYPVISDLPEPLIRPAQSVRPFMMAATSAAKQVKSRGKLAESVQAIFGVFKTLPAYEMFLTHDVRRNARALKSFLETLPE